jgi:hypothetical protein
VEEGRDCEFCALFDEILENKVVGGEKEEEEEEEEE